MSQHGDTAAVLFVEDREGLLRDTRAGRITWFREKPRDAANLTRRKFRVRARTATGRKLSAMLCTCEGKTWLEQVSVVTRGQPRVEWTLGSKAASTPLNDRFLLNLQSAITGALGGDRMMCATPTRRLQLIAKSHLRRL